MHRLYLIFVIVVVKQTVLKSIRLLNILDHIKLFTFHLGYKCSVKGNCHSACFKYFYSTSVCLDCSKLTMRGTWVKVLHT